LEDPAEGPAASTGSKTWVEYDGTTVTRTVWNGRAWLEEFDVNNAGEHIEGLTLRMYNPQSHQWNLYWGTSQAGNLGYPALPLIGDSKNGGGEFYPKDYYRGYAIFVASSGRAPR